MHDHDQQNRPAWSPDPPRPDFPRVDPRRLRMRMVERLAREGISNTAVLRAMGAVPRHLFVDEALTGRAYDAATLPIGRGQTISSPFTVARMTSLLDVREGMRVLEIGTGSGYQAAVLAFLGCIVHSVERLPELHEKSTALLKRLGCTEVHTWLADGTLGLPRLAPFERIIVTAGGPAVPHPLLEQLDDNGIMLIPVGNSKNQRLKRVFRRAGSYYEQDCGPAALKMIAKYYGKYYSLQYLRDKCGITKEGVSLLDLSTGAESIGLHTLALKCTVGELVEKVPFPVIVFWNGNHFIVVYGATKSHILVSDPTKGHVRYTHQDFKKGGKHLCNYSYSWLADHICDEGCGHEPYTIDRFISKYAPATWSKKARYCCT